jgi:hypothetical protein
LKFDTPFRPLLDAWKQGRPVVPLFGAGISACASIAFGQHIVDYLHRVQLLCKVTEG